MINSDCIPTRMRLEVSPTPCILVLFGGTGDLARRKLLPSLFYLHTQNLLHASSRIIGSGRTAHTSDSYRELVAQTLPANATQDARATFLARITYVATSTDDRSTFGTLARELQQLNHLEVPVPFNHLFYLSLPPTAYRDVIAALSHAKLLHEESLGGWRHVILEKPFGTDLKSANELDAFMKRHLQEHQIFRIDHYLGKETVQNILIFRLANTLFEPVWNADYIDHVQITVAETLGVEGRAAYYEDSGLVRDMLQNHLLQLVALVGMEAPAEFSVEAVQAKKMEFIRAVRTFPLETLNSMLVRGQYTRGAGCPAYRDEAGVDPHSMVETFVAAKLLVDNPRWRGVPFYVRSGKRLSQRVSTITLVFKPARHTLFGTCQSDVLTLRVQPNEGMSLYLRAKRPGPKLNMGELPLKFDYADLGAELDVPDAYGRLLLDAMLDDRMLFVCSDIITASWRLWTPVLESWQQRSALCPLHPYAAGTMGPQAADELMRQDGRRWWTGETLSGNSNNFN